MGRRGSRVLYGWQRRNARGEGMFFFNCDFTPCDFSLEHNCHINWGVPVYKNRNISQCGFHFNVA
jgi:hypothetical protein